MQDSLLRSALLTSCPYSQVPARKVHSAMPVRQRAQCRRLQQCTEGGIAILRSASSWPGSLSRVQICNCVKGCSLGIPTQVDEELLQRRAEVLRFESEFRKVLLNTKCSSKPFSTTCTVCCIELVRIAIAKRDRGAHSFAGASGLCTGLRAVQRPQQGLRRADQAAGTGASPALRYTVVACNVCSCCIFSHPLSALVSLNLALAGVPGPAQACRAAGAAPAADLARQCSHWCCCGCELGCQQALVQSLGRWQIKECPSYPAARRGAWRTVALA